MILPLAAIALPQRQMNELTFQEPEAVMPGQREIVLGPVPYRDTVMSMIYSKDHPATYDMKGVNPPSWTEYPIGHLRWSVREDTFGDQPCMAIREEGVYYPELHFRSRNGLAKTNITLEIKGTRTWWVSKSGKILREYEQRFDRRGIRTATCTYNADSIDMMVDEFGKRRIATLFPADMEALHRQFQPMIVDNKVVLREKSYVVYNPFTGGYESYTARVVGTFSGNYGALAYQGNHVNIEGKDSTVKVYVSKENDVAKIDLPKDCYVVLQATPPGKEGGKDAVKG